MPTNLTASFSGRRVPIRRSRAAAPLLAPSAPANAYAARQLVDPALAEPVARAYHYLDVVHDAYQRGGEPRLLQSYNDESELSTTAFVYDNALAMLAWLASPTIANVRRVRLVGDALLRALAQDDGRLRQAYAADGRAAALDGFGFGGSSTGDTAWAGIALAQLYIDTRIGKYLDGAVALGRWIGRQESPYHYGGYHGGVRSDGETPQRWASTEHNLDAYALFELLAKLTKGREWERRAERAAAFVRAMWNRRGRHFWTGTLGGLPDEDPNVVNTANVPEDAQSWAVLALRDPRFDGAVDWVTRSLRTTDADISGVSYSSFCRPAGLAPASALPHVDGAVWLEGTAHTALALLERGDSELARRLLFALTRAQETLGAGQTIGGRPLPAASGLVAATNAFDTGFEYGHFPRQHVGTTAWFLMAAQHFNPFE
ncbi:hypothetical protein [Symbioplanes lichenis]|uniref:hypothetical protein n=1 Tax=Symbioplanes lichenis TaxID=1629072 RepID=UPI0027398A28|nr:hypothetical protein [Actinoplanes lichenis]